MRGVRIQHTLSLVAAVVGCTGVISDPRDEIRPDERVGATNCTDPSTVADITPTRLLTRLQYNNTVADLLGNDSEPLRVNVSATGDLYDNNESGLAPTLAAVEEYTTIAPELAAEAVLSGAVPFSCMDAATACAQPFIVSFARRAFRRPPSLAEEALLMDLYARLQEPDVGDGPVEAFTAIVDAVLQMPAFLYRIEIGEGPVENGIARLSGYEIASRLSYFLWNSTPPDDLLDAAERGELDTTEGISEWAEWLLDFDGGQRARAALGRFHEQWLGIELEVMEAIRRDPAQYPELGPELAASMRNETLRFLEDLIFDSDGTIADVFSSSTSWVDRRVADLYGLEGAFDDSFERATLDPDQRAGVLTHPSVLTVRSKPERSNPIARGVFVAREILCIELGAPPGGVLPLEEEVAPGASFRDELEAHSQNPCASCHQVIDPLGLSFEHYDAIGRHRVQDEAGNPVDASGSVPLDGEETPVADAVDLAQLVAGSPSTRSCMTRRYLEYAVGRTMDRPEDACLGATLSSPDGDRPATVREVLLRVVTSDVFRFRRAVDPEVCP